MNGKTYLTLFIKDKPIQSLNISTFNCEISLNLYILLLLQFNFSSKREALASNRIAK